MYPMYPLVSYVSLYHVYPHVSYVSIKEKSDYEWDSNPPTPAPTCDVSPAQWLQRVFTNRPSESETRFSFDNALNFYQVDENVL